MVVRYTLQRKWSTGKPYRDLGGMRKLVRAETAPWAIRNSSLKGDSFYYYIGPLEPVIISLGSRAGSLLGTVIMFKCRREKTRDVQIGFISFAQPTGSSVRTAEQGWGPELLFHMCG